MSNKKDMNIVIVGHVDHGKSTIIGRLLADTKSLPEGKLEQVKERCRRNSKPFEYAFLLDALKDEQAQGITIDSARCFFNTEYREYIIIDAPGHIEFLKNMVTGASRAEAALLVIDANEGIQENSKRHGYMLSMLGIKQIAVIINKMDLVDYSEEVYKNIVNEYTAFLKKLDIHPKIFIPVSGMMGDNIAGFSDKTKWYKEKTVLEILDSFENEKPMEDKAFRMPVQAVYKFTRDGDSRRIVSGTVETGKLEVGDEVVFYPSGKKTKVKTIEAFNREPQKNVIAGYQAGFTITEQIYVKRGEVVTKANETKMSITSRFKTNLFWLGREDMIKNKDYYLKIGSSKVKVKIEKILRVIDASTLSNLEKDKIERHDVAEVILKTEEPIAFDERHVIDKTSRFVIVDNYEIAGGGIILQGLDDGQNKVREQVLLRNYKWIKGMISPEERAVRYNQKSSLILVTGKKGEGRQDIAKNLEKKLFEEGKVVYYLGIGNVLYGVDADIYGEKTEETQKEHLRRFSEVAYLLLDAGAVLIVTAIELEQEDLDIIKTIISPERISTVWVGDEITSNVEYDLHLKGFDNYDDAIGQIKTIMQDKGIIFKPF